MVGHRQLDIKVHRHIQAMRSVCHKITFMGCLEGVRYLLIPLLEATGVPPTSADQPTARQKSDERGRGAAGGADRREAAGGGEQPAAEGPAEAARGPRGGLAAGSPRRQRWHAVG